MAYVNATKVTKHWRDRIVYSDRKALIVDAEQIYKKLNNLGIPFSLELEPVRCFVAVWVPAKHSANLDTILNELFNR